MALGNLIHERRDSVIDHHSHLAQPALHVQQLPLIKPDTRMDRTGSSHGSDTSLMAGPRSGLDSLSVMRFPSPSIMHSSINYSDATLSPVPMMLPSITTDMAHHAPLYSEGDRIVLSQQQAKCYACATCRKGFSRRSDLARHGECGRIMIRFCTYYLFILFTCCGRANRQPQSASTAGTVRTRASFPTAARNLSNAPPSPFTSACTLAKSPISARAAARCVSLA